VDPGARAAYLELLKQRLTRADSIGESTARGRRRRLRALAVELLLDRGFLPVPAVPAIADRAVLAVPGLPGSQALIRLLARRGLAVIPDNSPRRRDAAHLPRGWRARRRRLAETERELGIDWPSHAETMSGLRRLDNVQACVASVVERGTPGDLVETGVWRGGTSIFMRAVLAAYGDGDRRVWVADSFQGLPKPDAAKYPADARVDYTIYPELSVGEQRVRANFERYGMLDERVRFLPGWFRDTLPAAPIERLAVMRLDGDLYESTLDALAALYPKLESGGYCIIDDYGAIEACRRAVDDYRRAHGIVDPMIPVDWTCVYWERS
jgi:O-methyltransferase